MSVRLHLKDAAEGERSITGEALHYLTRVLRLRAGDAFEVFDGQGRSFDATVKSLEESAAVLQLGPGRQSAPPRHICIVQGLPKADKLELVLQKCTELGASEFIPVAMKRSVVKLEAERGAKKQLRWQKIAEEAARQCGRAEVPVVREPLSLEQALLQLKGARVFILDEEERATSLASAYSALAPGDRAALIIGPEGGLERSEVELARQVGAKAVTLGRRVLRTETAALVALAIMQLLDGELGS